MDLKSLLSKVAPVLASAIGGPFAGVAVSTGLKALGIAPKPTNAENEALLTEAVKSNPEAALKLLQAENDFKLKMKELGIKESEIEAGDRANARQREVSTGDHTPRHLAYMLSFMVALMWYSLLKIPIPKDSSALLFSLAGAVSTAWIGAMAYFHGSSSGSKQKSEIISKMMD